MLAEGETGGAHAPPTIGELVAMRRLHTGRAPQWFTVEAYEGRDRDVYGRLAALGYEVWRPVVVVRTMRRWKGKALKDGERVRVFAPVFGRYLFVRVAMSDSVYNAVREQSGVYGWLCFGGTHEPAPVPDEQMRTYFDSDWKAVETPTGLNEGDTVKALVGPFAGFNGVVNRVDSRGTACVEMSIFGRPTPVVFPVGHVELVEHGRRPPIKRDVKKRQRKRA